MISTIFTMYWLIRSIKIVIINNIAELGTMNFMCFVNNKISGRKNYNFYNNNLTQFKYPLLQSYNMSI